MRMKWSNSQKLEQLYILYESKMYAVAYAILGNVSQSEDTVQDSFVKVADYLDRIKDVESYQTKALIVKIVRTTAINRYRKNQKETAMFAVTEEKDVVDPSDVIEKKLSEIHNSTILLEAAKDMAQIYKEVIELQYYDGLTTNEIADITGVDSATVRKRCERAKKYLYQHIKKEEGGVPYEEQTQYTAQIK